MPNPTRSYTIVANIAFSNQADQQVQYREAAYAWQQLLVAAGHTIPISMDGTNHDATGVNQWDNAAELEINTIGPGAYFVSRAPVGFTDVGQPELLSYMNNSGADTTPQDFGVLMTFGTYSGGTVTTHPTSSSTVTSVSSAPQIIGNTTVAPSYIATWRTTRGDVMMAIKREGVASFQSVIAFYANVDGNGGGRGSRRAWLWHAATSSDVFLSSFFTSNYFKGFDSGGTIVGAVGPYSTGWTGASSWTNGRDLNNEGIDVDIDIYSNIAAGGRTLGKWVDFYACAPNEVFGGVDDTESAQLNRRVVIGDIWAYLPTASLPLS